MIANIGGDDGLILPHCANPTGSNFRERQGCANISPMNVAIALIVACREALSIVRPICARRETPTAALTIPQTEARNACRRMMENPQTEKSRTALGFVDSVGRAAHTDDLDSFVLRQIASDRAVGHIGLAM